MSPNGKTDQLELVKSKSRHLVEPPRVLSHIKSTAISSCEQLLEHLFSATDDLFYDLSKRASSNNEENLYFEAMREIRIKKQGASVKFLQSVAENFSVILEANNHLEYRDTSDKDNTSNLSIVESDDLEVELALNNMVGRSRELYKEELYELSARLDHLLLQVNVDDDNNPLDPQQLATAFINACKSQLYINIKAKLILFKLFEKHVLKQFGHILSAANQVLIDAGILPKVPKNLSQTGANHIAADSTAETKPLPQEDKDSAGILEQLDYSALTTLMAAARLAKGSPQPGIAPINCFIFTSNPGPLMAQPELASQLTGSQPLIDRQLSDDAPKNIIGYAVQNLLAKKNPAAPQSLNQSEEDVINLVAMFFDQILADENLPVAVQSLICRLQIPILKVAVKDRSFFNNREHPARKLINIITEAGIGFDETRPLERDPLYRKIVDIIQTINRQYKTDDNIFVEFEQELSALIDKEKNKAAIVEQRTNQAETGKSKIKRAKSDAQELIYRKLKDVSLPQKISNFITNTWLQVLTIAHLKSGKDSADWIANEQAVSDMIWLCQPHEDERSKQRVDRLLPELLYRIASGLELAIESTEAREAKVVELEKVLTDIASDKTPQDEYQNLDEQQRDTLGRADPQQKSWGEMTALERQQAKYEELSNQFYEMAKNVKEGSWVEYFDNANNKKIRCKLAVKIDSESYIFVNRLGFKTIETSRKQFAYDMQFGKAKVLDTSPIFERIMNKVASHLKEAA